MNETSPFQIGKNPSRRRASPMNEPPPTQRFLITGATGLLGSHLVEKLRAGGVPVRALARPGADVAFLESLNVEVVRGDLIDPAACRRAVDGIQVVFHTASKVGDWGTWADFQRDCLDATDALARACLQAGAARFIHISSTSAYGHPPEGGPPVDETAPLGQRLWPIWDDYTRAKVEQERLLWRLVEERGLPLTVIRPSWLFGERDRTTTVRLVHRLRRGKLPLIGRGDNPLSAIYAGEVADAAIQAAARTDTIGEAFNITDQGPITQRAFFNLWAAACGAPPVRRGIRTFSYNLTFRGAIAFEAWGRLTRSPTPPLITRYATWLMGRDVRYSTLKARDRLGWSPRLSYEEAIRRTVEWLDGRDR